MKIYNTLSRRKEEFVPSKFCDGFNYAKGFKYLKSYMRDPSQLDTPPEKVVQDVR